MHSHISYYNRPTEHRNSPLRHSSPVRTHEFVSALSPERYSYRLPMSHVPRYVPTPAPYYHTYSPVKSLYAAHHHMSPARPSPRIECSPARHSHIYERPRPLDSYLTRTPVRYTELSREKPEADHKMDRKELDSAILEAKDKEIAQLNKRIEELEL